MMFKPREEVLTDVIWNGEDEVEFVCGAGHWRGAKRKDFWGPDDDWEDRIKVGSRIRLWTVQYSIVVGFELWKDGKWIPVWCMANDFRTKAERDKGMEAYVNFIEEEGNKIAEWIDDGKTLEEINSLISDEHTCNTYGWALGIGISKAVNKEYAENIRRVHNAKYGVEDKDRKGVVNPAILTVETNGKKE
jgi:hypothetical protein